MIKTKNTEENKVSKQKITCSCGNDTFRLSEHIRGPFRSLYIECVKCGNAISHGGGLTVRDLIFIMRGKNAKESETDLENFETS